MDPHVFFYHRVISAIVQQTVTSLRQVHMLLPRKDGAFWYSDIDLIVPLRESHILYPPVVVPVFHTVGRKG